MAAILILVACRSSDPLFPLWNTDLEREREAALDMLTKREMSSSTEVPELCWCPTWLWSSWAVCFVKQQMAADGSRAPINREQSLSNPTHKPKQKNACAHTLSHVCNTCKLAFRCRHFWVQKFCKYIHMQTHARWAMAEQLMKVLQAKR